MDSLPHEKSTRMFAESARAFRVDVDEFDNEKWSAGITMAKALDNLVDDDHVYDSGSYSERLLAGKRVPHITEDEARFVRATYDRFSDTSKEQWRDAATRLGEFALKRLEPTDIQEYMQVIFAESPLLANVLMLENDERRHDHVERNDFNAWMPQMMHTAYALDTMTDFIKDHNEGNMRVPLTPRAITVMARHACRSVRAFICVTPPPVYRALAKRSVTKSLEKARSKNFVTNQFVWKRES